MRAAALPPVPPARQAKHAVGRQRSAGLHPWQQVDAIESISRRRGRVAAGIDEGGSPIERDDRVCDGSTAGDGAWPIGNASHPDRAFGHGAAFVATQRGVIGKISAGAGRPACPTVVIGINDQSIVSDAGGVKFLDDFPDLFIHGEGHGGEFVTVGIDRGLAGTGEHDRRVLIRGGGESEFVLKPGEARIAGLDVHRRVNGGEGDIDEKRLGRVGRGEVRVNESDGGIADAVGEIAGVFTGEIRCHLVLEHAGLGGAVIIRAPSGPHAIPAVEAAEVRVEIHGVAHVPFPDAVGAVAQALEAARHGALGDGHAVVGRAAEVVFRAGALLIAPCQESAARGMADRAGHVGVREAGTGRCEGVQLGSGEFWIPMKAEVGITAVIGENKDNVRPGWRGGPVRQRREGDGVSAGVISDAETIGAAVEFLTAAEVDELSIAGAIAD